MATVTMTPEEIQEMVRKFKQSPVENASMVPLMIAITTLAMLFVILRLFTRRWILQSVGWDDIIILPAAAMAIAYTTIACKMPDYGWGHHMDEIPPLPDYLRNSYFYIFVVQMLFIATVTLVKISILFFYLRMSHVVSSPSFRIAIFIVMGYSAAWGISTFTMVFLQCTPIENFWSTNYALRDRTCRSWSGKNPKWLYAQGTTNMAGDLMVLVLPMKVVWTLALPMKEKIGLAGLFGLGIMACICEILRVIYAARIYWSTDITWKGYYGFVLGIVEVQVGILCASIPATKPFWTALFSYLKAMTLSGLNRDASLDKSWMTNTTTTGNRTQNGDGGAKRSSKRFSWRMKVGANDVQEIIRYDSNQPSARDEVELDERETRYGEGRYEDRYGSSKEDVIDGSSSHRVAQSRHIINIQEFERGIGEGEDSVKELV